MIFISFISRMKHDFSNKQGIESTDRFLFSLYTNLVVRFL